MHAAHPLTVAFSQVVVDGDDVHAVAGQRIEVSGQHTGQGLAFTGLHLGNVAQVQGGRTHHLHVERPLVQHPPGGLAGHGEGLGQQVVEGFWVFLVGQPPLELVGFRPQLGVGEFLDIVGQSADIVGHLLEALDHATFAKAQQLRQHSYVPACVGVFR
ncbi:Uncharacterised protein [Mycobacterium tuberculosis]|uniref:Uncharacterized protein n=1 Tax=Mycobacterium tuberculosis TaxID=1773 RepID=A0A654ZZF1_MYCTX|nr:Uncharacterised protein [Mycobacterium tuberculosis]CFS03550.1 Uncharacterised protein [Mycobacterium tuberculosis]CFS30536.1 Uncharacterised protein [Mycobacterium tuberculosis]CKM88734.1 Uncharacterised protein [Mycobacterium tuberculosis]CKP28638.1 Uncharacterised protein [Mycobacterium tuberculosis]